MQLRILPLVIFFAFALVVAKVADLGLIKGTENNFDIQSNIQAVAASEGDEDGGEGNENEEAGEDGPKQHNAPKNVEISDQAPMERILLENLSKRRKELDDWANTISMKESVLNATEKKINSKMMELKKLEMEVSKLLKQYEQKEEGKHKKLVKIYEGMKPADAAKILNKMEMSILLEIAGGMKEDAASKIVAKMDTNKARALTMMLANQRRLGKMRKK